MADEKKYKCKYCKQKFILSELRLKMPQVCDSCIGLYFEENKDKIAKKVKTQREKHNKKLKQEKLDKLKTHSDWLKELQTVFNRYIRLRDKDKGCVSCGKQLKGKYDAGHLFSVGAFPNLRFDEFNVHAQCTFCNMHQHGNISEYMIRLPKRIGQEQFDLLLERRNVSNKLTIPEIIEKKEYYLSKIKELKT